MSCNVGGIERAVRILLGVALLSIGYFHVLTGGLAILAYVLGAIALVTGLIGFCPAWTLLHINTCATRSAKVGGSAH